VKAYIKRNKHDAADAEAICEAVGRPTMRFVPVKTAEQQAGPVIAHLLSCLEMDLRCLALLTAKLWMNDFTGC
jgi:transposase